MKFYILYVRTRRIRVEVGGWEWNTDERRERLEQQINAQIVMPAQTPYTMITGTTNLPGHPYVSIGRGSIVNDLWRSVGEVQEIAFKAMLENNAQTLKESSEK